jgi:hypothetical protein
MTKLAPFGPAKRLADQIDAVHRAAERLAFDPSIPAAETVLMAQLLHHLTHARNSVAGSVLRELDAANAAGTLRLAEPRRKRR